MQHVKALTKEVLAMAQAQEATEALRKKQLILASGFAYRVSKTDKKLAADLDAIFSNYNPNVHLVGVKATYDVKVGYKDKQTKTVQYVAGTIVKDAKKFDPKPTCGGGLHFSYGHCTESMRNTFVMKTEKGARFHIALADASKSVVVENNKFKVPDAEIVFTGSFKDCFRLLQPLFGLAGASHGVVTLS